jgi:succinoglycan biosynthesis transport protein ExoP
VTATPLQALGVLPAGQRPPDPAEFVGTQALAETLAEVSQYADVVIVDSPPLLHFSDALTLSTAVDAMIVVSRIDLVRRNMLTELNRLLATCTAVKLGFVLTGAEHDESSAYGYKGYNYRQQADDDPWSADSISQESTPRTAESTGSSA